MIVIYFGRCLTYKHRHVRSLDDISVSRRPTFRRSVITSPVKGIIWVWLPNRRVIWLVVQASDSGSVTHLWTSLRWSPALTSNLCFLPSCKALSNLTRVRTSWQQRSKSSFKFIKCYLIAYPKGETREKCWGAYFFLSLRCKNLERIRSAETSGLLSEQGPSSWFSMIYSPG